MPSQTGRRLENAACRLGRIDLAIHSHAAGEGICSPSTHSTKLCLIVSLYMFYCIIIVLSLQMHLCIHPCSIIVVSTFCVYFSEQYRTVSLPVERPAHDGLR